MMTGDLIDLSSPAPAVAAHPIHISAADGHCSSDDETSAPLLTLKPLKPLDLLDDIVYTHKDQPTDVAHYSGQQGRNNGSTGTS